MAGFTNQRETDILDLYLTNVNAPNIGDAAGLLASATVGSLHLGCHTTGLTDADTAQNSFEATYTGYARQAVPRNVSNWTVTGDTGSNDNLIQFGEMTAGGPITITDVGFGFALSGVGYLDGFGAVVANLVVNNGVNPQLAPGAFDLTLD